MEVLAFIHKDHLVQFSVYENGRVIGTLDSSELIVFLEKNEGIGNLYGHQLHFDIKSVLSVIAQEKNQNSLAGKRRYSMVPGFTIAAAIGLILCSLGVLFYTLRSGNFLNHAQLENQVIAGVNRVLLHIDDGKNLILENDQEGIKLSNGYVQYCSSRIKALPYKIKDQLILNTSRGALYEVILADGTKVWLNAASSLKFPASFDGEPYRRVELTGEAYFEVAKNSRNGQQKLPFIVATRTQEITVTGTHFNVHAYPDEVSVKTTLLEGSVCVRPTYDNNLSSDPAFRPPLYFMAVKKALALKPNQQAIVENMNIRVKTVRAEESIAWIKGDYVFRKASLKSVMSVLSHWYDIEVLYEKNSQADREILGGIVSSSTEMSEVLSSLEQIAAVHFKVSGRTVTVME